MPSRPYSISFTLAREDLGQLFGAGTNWRSHQEVLIPLASVFVVMFILVQTHLLDWLFPRDNSESIQVTFNAILGLLVTVPLAYYVGLPLVVGILNQFQLWRHPEVLGERTVTITDAQLLYGLAEGTIAIDWSTFKYRLENDKVFALCYVDKIRGDSVLHVPKRAFADAEQLADFISLLEKSVPTYNVATANERPS